MILFLIIKFANLSIFTAIKEIASLVKCDIIFHKRRHLKALINLITI